MPRIIDTDITIPLSIARALKANGVDGALRCVCHSPQFDRYNLSASERTDIEDTAGIELHVYRMYRTSGWSAETGASDALELLAAARLACVKGGRVAVIDFEGGDEKKGIAPPTNEVAFAYAMAARHVLRSSEFAAGAYWGIGFVGTYGAQLTAVQLDALDFDVNWSAGAYGTPTPAKGFSLRQLPQTTIAGLIVDPDEIDPAGPSMFAFARTTYPAINVEPIAMFPGIAGETEADRVCRIVESLADHSEDNDPGNLLARLLSRDVDNASTMLHLHTDCATFGCAVYWATGSTCPVWRKRYLVDGVSQGDAMGRLVFTCGAYVRWDGKTRPPRGSGLHYATQDGSNDDHWEFITSDVDAAWKAKHGGAGRARNAVTIGASEDIRTSLGRPLRGYIPPASPALAIPLVVAPSVEPPPVVAPTAFPSEPDTTPATPDALSTRPAEPTKQPIAPIATKPAPASFAALIPIGVAAVIACVVALVSRC